MGAGISLKATPMTDVTRILSTIEPTVMDTDLPRATCSVEAARTRRDGFFRATALDQDVEKRTVTPGLAWRRIMLRAWRGLNKIAIGVLFVALLGRSASGVETASGDDASFADGVKVLCRRYVAGFGSEQTQLTYHHRLDGPRGVNALASPVEIGAGTVNGRLVPYGYGSGIQDVALESGQLLFALCEAFEASEDLELGDLARWVFRGLCRVATVSAEPGFVPRGPHPDGASYYTDSSRDQHAALAEALWRYGRSPLATEEDRRFIARELDEMARRLEAHDWKIMVEDRSRVAHVGFSWKQATSTGAASLLSCLAMVADATGDPYWQGVYRRFSAEKDSFRWKELLDPGAADRWKPFTLYSNQFSQALLALKRSEPDPQRRQQIGQLLRRLARRALHSDVFDSAYWRRLDWAGDAEEEVTRRRLIALGISSAERCTVLDLWDSFDASWWQADDRAIRFTGSKLCFGIPTAAFHKALLSEDPELVAEVAPHVRRMVRIMLEHGHDYERGENYNRTVVLGLLLLAAETRNNTNGRDRTSDAGNPGPSNDVELPLLGGLDVGPAMDVTLDGKALYVIGGGKLSIFDVSDPQSPRATGTIGGLGHVRQLCVRRGIAYVTAREDGLFLVDVATPAKMQVLSHYDTIELATGIAVSGDVALVACRTAGVELVDVSTPEKPVHLSTVRTGEAQSVAVRDGILYAGVWATGELVTCDVSKPRAPAVLARAALDGYGDGVDVRGDYCYVATGHHSRSLPHRVPADPGYGRGHGLEILDVSDPQRPQFVGRVKFPPLYRLGMDMWSVTATDRYAFVADTYNGVFVVDLAEPSEPRVVSHRKLPFMAERNDPSPAAGLALGHGVVFVAGAWSDVHVLGASMAKPVVPEPDLAPTVGPPIQPEPDPCFRAYRPPGQVHAVDFDDVAFLACGSDGLHAIEVSPKIRPLRTYPTAGVAFDVAVRPPHVYVAEGDGGLSIWKHIGQGELDAQGRYRVAGESIRQVVVPAAEKYALLHVGPNTLHVVDITNPNQPTCVFRDSRLGLFYYGPIAEGQLADRYACCHWHVSGLYWYDLADGAVKWAGQHYPYRIGSRNGVAVFDERALVTCRGGYALISLEEARSPKELDVHRVPGLDFHGKPTLRDDMLYVADRNAGRVTVIDVTDPARPRLVDQVQLAEHPGPVAVHDGVAVIPAGYQGLLVWEGCGRD